MGAHQASNKSCYCTLLKTIQIQQHGGLTNFSKQICLEIKIYFLKCSMSDKIAAFPENNDVSQIICIALQKYDRTRYEILYSKSCFFA